MKPTATRRNRRDPRGGIYLAVLGSAMVVAILGMSALTVVRLEQLASEASSDSIKARSYAESAVELGMLEIEQNALWRLRANGVWETNRPIGDGTYTVQVTDPYDGNLGNNPRDPVIVRGVGVKGQARHIVEVSLVDRGSPITAIGSALAGAGAVQIASGGTLTVTGGPVSSNGTLTNNGTVNGNAEALLILGSINGSSTILSLGKSMPASTIPALYQKMGTAIAPGSTMERAVLVPKYTTYGPTNADGIYVVSTSGDLRIRDLRIEGTLVVLAPGNTVTVEGSVCWQSFRADCPALIVQGNLVLRFDRTQALSEAATATNFNPPNAAYNGSDNDQNDQYPCEIKGLVHATGTLVIEQRPRVYGCVIAEGAPLLADGIRVSGDAEIVHNSMLLSEPPIGYSTNPDMQARDGTWARVTLP